MLVRIYVCVEYVLVCHSKVSMLVSVCNWICLGFHEHEANFWLLVRLRHINFTSPIQAAGHKPCRETEHPVTPVGQTDQKANHPVDKHAPLQGSKGLLSLLQNVPAFCDSILPTMPEARYPSHRHIWARGPTSAVVHTIQRCTVPVPRSYGRDNWGPENLNVHELIFGDS